jgi:hypothetical protein
MHKLEHWSRFQTIKSMNIRTDTANLTALEKVLQGHCSTGYT